MNKLIIALIPVFLLKLTACGVTNHLYETHSSPEGIKITKEELPQNASLLYVTSELVSIDGINAAKIPRIDQFYVLEPGFHQIQVKDAWIKSTWGMLGPGLRAKGLDTLSIYTKAKSNYTVFFKCRDTNFWETECTCVALSVMKGMKKYYPSSPKDLVAGDLIIGRGVYNAECSQKGCSKPKYIGHVRDFCQAQKNE